MDFLFLQIIFVCASVFAATSSAGVLTAPQAYVSNTLHAPQTSTVEYHGPTAVEIHAPAVGTSSNSITRSFDGTVSHITKNVETPFSSVSKSVSKVSNKVYPAYAVHQPAYTVHQPVATYSHAPVTTYSHAPVTTYTAAASPVTHYAAAPVAHYAEPFAKTTVLRAPQAHIAYSPAELVSHVVYDAPSFHYEW